MKNSRPVFSNQKTIHPNLEKLLKRHCESSFQKNILEYNRRAFDSALEQWQKFSKKAPLILDSVCGTAESTVFWARQNPQCFVFGVEKSQNRLNRQNLFKENLPQNCAFVRADVVDFWRLLASHLAENGIFLQRHFLLYPNPYPKSLQLQRRFHGHSVFPFLKMLGGILECRTNWRVYAQEFAFACQFLGAKSVALENFVPEFPVSAFERKYFQSGHLLWRCVADFSKK